MLEGWPNFTAPSVLSHCLGEIVWRSKGRGWGGECGLSGHSSISKGTAAGGCQTAMLLGPGFPEGEQSGPSLCLSLLHTVLPNWVTFLKFTASVK